MQGRPNWHQITTPSQSHTLSRFLFPLSNPNHLSNSYTLIIPLSFLFAIIFAPLIAPPPFIMAPRRSTRISRTSHPYSPSPPAARRSQRASRPSNRARLATASSQTETESTQELLETPNASETSHSEPTELANLRAQRDNARQLRVEAEMASMCRQMIDRRRPSRHTGIVVKSFINSIKQSNAAGREPALPTTATRGYIWRYGWNSLTLRTEYPMISHTYFRQIAENKFDPVNLSKLCTDVVLAKTATKTINLAKGIEIQTGEKDASVSELKGLPHLICCLGVYRQIKLHLAPPSLRHSLCRAFSIYQDWLLWLYPIHTWESLRNFHVIFHKSRIYQGIDGPVRWKHPDLSLEHAHLVWRDTKPLYQVWYNNGSSNPNGSFDNIQTTSSYSCRKFNAGIECYPNCRYQHVCSKYSGNHTAKAAHQSSNSNTNSNTNSRPPPARTNPNLIPQGRQEWLSNPFTHISESFSHNVVDKLEPIQQGPLLLEGWKLHLADHPNKPYTQTIFDIITYRAKIGYTGPDQLILSKNLASAEEAPKVLTKDLEHQIAHNQLINVKWWWWMNT